MSAVCLTLWQDARLLDLLHSGAGEALERYLLDHCLPASPDPLREDEEEGESPGEAGEEAEEGEVDARRTRTPDEEGEEEGEEEELELRGSASWEEAEGKWTDRRHRATTPQSPKRSPRSTGGGGSPRRQAASPRRRSPKASRGSPSASPRDGGRGTGDRSSPPRPPVPRRLDVEDLASSPEASSVRRRAEDQPQHRQHHAADKTLARLVRKVDDMRKYVKFWVKLERKRRSRAATRVQRWWRSGGRVRPTPTADGGVRKGPDPHRTIPLWEDLQSSAFRVARQALPPRHSRHRLRFAAAVGIQAWWRGIRARRAIGRLLVFSAAAVPIQAAWRGVLARRKVKAERPLRETIVRLLGRVGELEERVRNVEESVQERDDALRLLWSEMRTLRLAVAGRAT